MAKVSQHLAKMLLMLQKFAPKFFVDSLSQVFCRKYHFVIYYGTVLQLTYFK